MDKTALFKISYGLYVLTAKDCEKDNGCIINTTVQVTDSPCRISVAVNKLNYTAQMIQTTGKFNICVLTESTPFSLFENFGFKSGKDCNKFENVPFSRSANGIAYLTENTNAFLSCNVISVTDVGTHLLFLADVVDGEVLSKEESITYSYYHKHTKPKPKKEDKKGYRCKICGYVYEGETLPDDFVCPWCKHTAEVFEKIE